MRPLVSIIVLNYKQRKVTADCLDSLRKVKKPSFEVILVDNNSSDGSVPYFRKQYPWVRLIPNKANSFFAKGNNVGVKYARGTYILLLNNDVLVEKNFLERLLQAIHDNKTAVVGSEDKHFPFKHQTLNLLLYHVPAKTDSNNVFYVPGYCILYKKSLIKQPFDDVYTIYGEDTSLCWQMHLQGKGVKLVDGSKIYHLGSKSIGHKSFRHVYLGERNRIINIFSHFAAGTLLKIMPLFLLGIFLRFFVDLFLFRKSAFYRLRAYWWHLTHLGYIFRKRKEIQAVRSVSDEPILKLMSCKMVRGNNIFSTLVNRISFWYCEIVGLKTIEFYP